MALVSASEVTTLTEQIENRMVVDSEWEEVEFLQMRRPDKPSRRLKRNMDELENGSMEEREE